MRIHNLTICEDARMEINGKFFLIGVYGNEITFPNLPAAFNFLIWFLAEHETKGFESLSVRGKFVGSDKEAFEFSAEVDVENADIWSPIGLGTNIQVQEECELAIEAKFNGEWAELRRLRLRLPPSPAERSGQPSS